MSISNAMASGVSGLMAKALTKGSKLNAYAVHVRELSEAVADSGATECLVGDPLVRAPCLQ